MYEVKLDLTKGKFWTDHRKDFDNLKDARSWAYHLMVSNFDNPYDIPILLDNEMISLASDRNEHDWERKV